MRIKADVIISVYEIIVVVFVAGLMAGLMVP